MFTNIIVCEGNISINRLGSW